MTTVGVARLILVGASLGVAAAVLAVAAVEPARMDFVAQYAAARLVLEGRGDGILQPTTVLAAEHAAAPARQALLPYVQAPAVALLLAPLAALPFDGAFLVVAACDAVFLAISLALLRGGGAGARALLFVAVPSAVAVAQGQLTPLVLLLVALASRLRPRSAGLALGLTLIRPQTAPLLLLAGLADPARRAGTIVGGAIVVLLSMLAVGVEGLSRYAAVLLDASSWTASGELGLRGSVGWAGIAHLLGVPWLGIALPAACLVLGARATLGAPAADRVATSALWSLLASPHVLLHDAVLAYPRVLAFPSRRLWDIPSVSAWILHLFVAPIGVGWSVVLALASWLNARQPR